MFAKHPTSEQNSYTRRILSHEISHMWFGNMVTMKWWDNIWLNESFADFFSYLCCIHLQEALPYEDCQYNDEWLSFAERK